MSKVAARDLAEATSIDSKNESRPCLIILFMGICEFTHAANGVNDAVRGYPGRGYGGYPGCGYGGRCYYGCCGGGYYGRCRCCASAAEAAQKAAKVKPQNRGDLNFHFPARVN
ncbi:hypothetical protein CRG98_015388 [Punica granatum]|uniref:Glycine-rich protein-like n=1 Tax=Punica granatum TaxID=22663 RepID=A0A2I0K6L8_PUNGR|nr:hypothetical protein CRG98_015388 [Punica granatum]